MFFLYAGPFQILVVLAMLIRIIGVAPAFAGFGATLLLIPASLFAGRRMAKIRKELVGRTDRRVRLTTEVISGKPCFRGWEFLNPRP